MRNVTLLVCVLLFAFFTSNFAKANGLEEIFVGNGGDGVKEGQRLFLRDLFQVGVHRSPWFGEEIDPDLLKAVSTIHFPVEFDSRLLARKLTDLNFVDPALGSIFVQAIKMHNWLVVDQPLSNVPAYGDPVVVDSYVQLASRLGPNIRLNKQGWEKLDPENQIALLLHEVVFTFAKPQNFGRGEWHQNALQVREITGALFQNTFWGPRVNSLRRLILDHLQIELGLGSQENDSSGNFGKVEIRLVKKSGIFSSASHPLPGFFFELFQNHPKDAEVTLGKICTEVQSRFFHEVQNDLFLEGSVFRPRGSIELTPYFAGSAEWGSQQFALRAKIAQTQETEKKYVFKIPVWKLKSHEDCLLRMREVYSSAFY
jgi:hypothetical protein